MTIQEALQINGKIPNPIDALSVGAQVTVIGLIIVFAVLIILMAVLVAMKYIFAPKTKKEEKIVVAEAPKAAVAPVAETEDDEELIAVLTAAIAASLNTSTYNLKIKSFRRVNPSSSAWSRAGLNETINARF